MWDPEVQYSTFSVNSFKKKTRFILKLISGDHLPCDSKESLLKVSISIHGHKLDNSEWSSKTLSSGGFNLLWNETAVFDMFYPELTIVEFKVNSVDEFSGAEKTLGYFMISFPMIRKGYRRLILESMEGKKLTPSALFVHCKIEGL